MPTLVLINGAPGSGKSTLASLLAQDKPLTLALDIDLVLRSLGQWRSLMPEAGLTARRIAIAMIDDHLRHGHDVVVSQYVARTEFIVELAELASVRGARFVELILVADVAVLRARLASRRAMPERIEHRENADLVPSGDVPSLVHSIERVIQRRTGATVIDANGSPACTLDLIRASALLGD